MNKAEILLRVADHIDEHPECYTFSETATPREITCYACMLGWVGFFAGNIPKNNSPKSYISLTEQARLIGFESDIAFYEYMNHIEHEARMIGENVEDWQDSAQSAASMLRELADRS